jgi:hypothetical protein
VDISLAGADFGSLKIYDILGRVVAILADGYLPAGHSVFQFDGTHLSSGTYFVILRTAGTTASRKMNLVK